MIVTLYSVPATSEISVDSQSEYYSRFFSSLEEACGSVPDRVEVPTYVIEQFPSWLRLLKMIETMREGTELPTRVYLADVEAILGFLIDIPEEAWLYICLDERTGEEARKRHYKLTGRLFRMGEGENPFPWLEQFLNAIYRNGAYTLDNDPFRLARTDEERSAAMEFEWLTLAAGIMNDTLLKQIVGPSYTADPWFSDELCNFVKADWSLLSGEEMTYEISMERVKEAETRPPIGAMLRTGRRVPRGYAKLGECVHANWISTSEGDNSLVVFSRPDGLLVAEIGDGHSYSMLLQSLTDEQGVSILSPVDFGISMLLTDGRYTDAGDHIPRNLPTKGNSMRYQMPCWNLIGCIHAATLAKMNSGHFGFDRGTYCLVIDPSRFWKVAALVIKQLGKPALRSMVATLQHYNPEDPNTRLFAEAAALFLD